MVRRYDDDTSELAFSNIFSPLESPSPRLQTSIFKIFKMHPLFIFAFLAFFKQCCAVSQYQSPTRSLPLVPRDDDHDHYRPTPVRPFTVAAFISPYPPGTPGYFIPFSLLPIILRTSTCFPAAHVPYDSKKSFEYLILSADNPTAKSPAIPFVPKAAPST